MGEEKSGRSHLLPLLAIGAIASACGIALGLAINWFPIAASEEAKPIDTLWDVLVIVVRPDLRHGRDDRALQRVALPHAAGRGAQGRPADPRQHAARGDLDRDPGDHPRRALLLRLRGAARHRDGRGQRDEGPRRRRAVHLDLLLPREAAAGRRSPPTSSTCPRASRSASTSSPRTSCTTSGCRPSARRSTRCRASRRSIRVKPIKTGTFPVVCAELCGLGHSVMRQSAHVVSPAPPSTSGSQDKRRKASGGGQAGGGPGRRRRGAADGKALFTSGARRPALLPHARRRGRRRHDRPEPRRGAQGQGRGLHPGSRSRTRAPRWRRASRTGSCPPTTRTTLQAG